MSPQRFLNYIAGDIEVQAWRHKRNAWTGWYCLGFSVLR